MSKPTPPGPRVPRHPAAYEPDDSRPDVFDPALKHHPAAFIKGPHRFESDKEERGFRDTRARILRQCLAGIGRSTAGEQVVARGSAVLAQWYREQARPAKDIDLVVTPDTMGPSSDEGTQLLTNLTRAVTDALRMEGFELDPAAIPVDEIWTYERAEGRRITFPWSWKGRIRDSVQVDVVFNERLLSTLVELTVDGVSLLAASPEESLAWKLLWLSDDMYPQGKDLYDAVLLAENVTLPPGLLRSVFKEKDGMWNDAFEAGVFPPASNVDWRNFALEHPSLAQGSAESLRARLEQALRRRPKVS